jgi:hypothetical protein
MNNNTVNNLSKFKPSKLMRDKIEDIVLKIYNANNLYNKDEVIYISGPMTGVDDYRDRFNTIEEKIKYVYSDQDIYIINPINILDKLSDNEANYIDNVFLTFALLELSTIIMVDDTNDNWLNSRGTLIELTYANKNGITIYGMDWLYNAVRFKKYLSSNIANPTISITEELVDPNSNYKLDSSITDTTELMDFLSDINMGNFNLSDKGTITHTLSYSTILMDYLNNISKNILLNSDKIKSVAIKIEADPNIIKLITDKDPATTVANKGKAVYKFISDESLYGTGKIRITLGNNN